MNKLLKKELLLSMHPTALLFLALSAMLLIPNYPYYFVFFYTALAVFFTCLNGRENHDVFYTLALPVAKRDIVRARMDFVMLLETAQCVLAVPFAAIRQMMPIPGNQVGMDANIALFGVALVLLGVFNLVFFTAYYRDVTKVGTAFLLGTVVMVFLILLAEASVHIVPFIRDRLDTPEPYFLTEKFILLTAGVLHYLLLNFIARRIAIKSFEKQDL